MRELAEKIEAATLHAGEPSPGASSATAPAGFADALVDALPAAVYTTDAAGRITYYNAAAAALWGRRPELGRSEFCGSWLLFWPDGTPLPHEECPMALALKRRRAIKGAEAVAERPDGSRVSFLAFPTPLFDASGALAGAVNMLVDVTEVKATEQTARRLAAIIESSDDAIISKNLDGVITSWNQGAARLFGYSADEAVGMPITMLIPADRQDEEPGILARIRRGERVDHYETIRRRKDGSLIEISITVSPVRNALGTVVGASKIARDITERRRAEERQWLLLREMNHRVKNLFAVASGVVALSARTATDPKALSHAIQGRLAALARAHSLTLPPMGAETGPGGQATTLHSLIRTIVAPYDCPDGGGVSRMTISGADPAVSGGAVTSLALLLHEFATNAAKYGALSTAAGRVAIDCAEAGDSFVITWREQGGPPVTETRGDEGFGSLLTKATVTGQLGGSISRSWAPEGLTIVLTVAGQRLEG